jgi:hypothetical protein
MAKARQRRHDDERGDKDRRDPVGNEHRQKIGAGRDRKAERKYHENDGLGHDALLSTHDAPEPFRKG